MALVFADSEDMNDNYSISAKGIYEKSKIIRLIHKLFVNLNKILVSTCSFISFHLEGLQLYYEHN